MSMIDRSLDGMAYLSVQLGAVVRRRLREVSGIAMISFAMMAALALATWSVRDPSLSHATDAPVHNLLGRPGAHCGRPDNAIARPGLAGLAAAHRSLGLPLARPPPAQPRKAAHGAVAARRGFQRRVRIVFPERRTLAAAVRPRRRDRRRHAAAAHGGVRLAADRSKPPRRRNRSRHSGTHQLCRRGRHALGRSAG